MTMILEEISSRDIQEIKAQVALVRQENEISDLILRDRIFNLLEKEGTLIFYPLKDLDVWGIYIYKKNRNFFIINSSLQQEKQVFAAAHELAHSKSFAKVNIEVVRVENLKDYYNGSKNHEDVLLADRKANRFAAELLIPSKDIKDKFMSIKKLYDVTAISLLMSNYYLVPYKTILRRLYEENLISEKQLKIHYEVPEDIINMYIERFEICSENKEVSNRKYLGGYVDKSITLYDNLNIDYDRLEKYLKLLNKSPEDYDKYPDIDFVDILSSYSEE